MRFKGVWGPAVVDGVVLEAGKSRLMVCEDCGGSGFSHCCEGLTACNDDPGGE